jgi:hypothetical protein
MPETVQLLRTKSDTDTSDDQWWEDGTEPPDLAEMPLGCNRVLVWLHMVDEDGVRLANNTTTVDVTIVPVGRARLVDGETVTLEPLVGDTVPLTGHSVVRVIDLAMPMSLLASPPAGIDATRVYWVPYKA